MLRPSPYLLKVSYTDFVLSYPDFYYASFPSQKDQVFPQLNRGPTSVKSLNGHFYMAARIDDATRETKLYFQEKKSETLRSYKMDEAYIETQTGNCIKTVRSD